MILAAFFLAVVLNSDETETLSQSEAVEAVVEMDAPVIRHAMIPPKQSVVSNLDNLTFAEYEAMIPTFPPVPTVSLAEEFMYNTLHHPKVMKMSMQEFQQAILPVGSVVSHMWVNETATHFIRYGSITTPFSNIYVKCTLDENGGLSKNTTLHVCFDNPALPLLLEMAAAQHPERFPPCYTYQATTIRSTFDLLFLFGNGVDIDNVSQYLAA